MGTARDARKQLQFTYDGAGLGQENTPSLLSHQMICAALVKTHAIIEFLHDMKPMCTCWPGTNEDIIGLDSLKWMYYHILLRSLCVLEPAYGLSCCRPLLEQGGYASRRSVLQVHAHLSHRTSRSLLGYMVAIKLWEVTGRMVMARVTSPASRHGERATTTVHLWVRPGRTLRNPFRYFGP